MGTRSRKRSVDARERLIEDPFEFRSTKSGQLMISRGGRVVVTMGGRAADALVAKLERADERERQLLLAKATGNYRHGNER